MNKESQFRKLFKVTSLLTDLFPNSGGTFIDKVLHFSVGNKFLLNTIASQSIQKINKVNKFHKILVVADINIGDAIISISAVSALKEIFPYSELDLVVKKSTKDLILGNPDISNLYPVFVGAPTPNENDLIELTQIAKNKNYDLVINFSPMIDKKIFGNKNVVNYTLMAAQLVRNDINKSTLNHINYLSYNFIGSLFNKYLPANFGHQFKGSDIYLSNEAIDIAKTFLLSQKVPIELPIIMFNPDASAKFTRIPIDVQIDLLNNFIDLDVTILLGAGHVEKLIEQKIINSLPLDKRQNIKIIPASIKLDAYTALIDLSDIYVSGDTGPLHLAAARKYLRETGRSLRNRTIIYSIFGATPPRVYGYDSNMEGFFAANQDVPSKIFISKSPCRNITCIDKLGKVCSDVRCFQSLDTNKIVSETKHHLDLIRKHKIKTIEIYTKRKIVA